MNPALILQALVTYGPAVLPLIQQVATWIKSGKTDVTPEDIQILIDFGKKKADDYYADLGIAAPTAPTAPVPATPPTPAKVA